MTTTIGGKVSVAAPTYDAGMEMPVTMDTSGRVRVLASTVDPATGLPQAPGRAAAASSAPVVLSTEDFAELKRATAAAASSVASSATPVTLKAANGARLGLMIANDSTSILYVLLGGGTVSASLYTFAIPAKGTTAADRSLTGYIGVVTGVWASANGAALVTELA